MDDDTGRLYQSVGEPNRIVEHVLSPNTVQQMAQYGCGCAATRIKEPRSEWERSFNRGFCETQTHYL